MHFLWFLVSSSLANINLLTSSKKLSAQYQFRFHNKEKQRASTCVRNEHTFSGNSSNFYFSVIVDITHHSIFHWKSKCGSIFENPHPITLLASYNMFLFLFDLHMLVFSVLFAFAFYFRKIFLSSNSLIFESISFEFFPFALGALFVYSHQAFDNTTGTLSTVVTSNSAHLLL